MRRGATSKMRSISFKRGAPFETARARVELARVQRKLRSTAPGPGSYALMPAGMSHFAFTRSETTIMLFGTGPVGFQYVNPAGDPRTTN